LGSVEGKKASDIEMPLRMGAFAYTKPMKDLHLNSTKEVWDDIGRDQYDIGLIVLHLCNRMKHPSGLIEMGFGRRLITKPTHR